jgi:transposase
VRSERSTGDGRGGITNTRARRVLIESAWTYRHPPRLTTTKRFLVERAPRPVREICLEGADETVGSHRALTSKGKRSIVIVAAVARELAGFVWAIGREIAPAR